MNRFKVFKEIKSIRAILPAFAVLLTGKSRYIPKIEWSNESWTHNIFRFGEMLFGRQVGIRAEITTIFDGINTYSYAHSFEGSCALLEVAIRKALNFKLKFVKVEVPILSFGNLNAPMPMKQTYMFAIAFDASSSLGSTQAVDPRTWAHTCTGSNRELVVSANVSNVGIPASATYNSVSMTKRGVFGGTNPFGAQFTLVAPSTGSNTVSVSQGGTNGSGSFCGTGGSFSGVDQTTDVGTTNTNTGNNVDILTTYTNSMLVDLIGDDTNEVLTKHANQTQIAQVAGTGANPQKGASSYRLVTSITTYNMSWTGNTGTVKMAALELKEVAATASGKFLMFM